MSIPDALGATPFNAAYDDPNNSWTSTGSSPGGGGGIPFAGMSEGVPSGVGTTMAASTVPGAAGAGMTAQQWMQLASLGMGMLGGRGGGQQPMAPELRRLLQLQTQRVQQGQPLYDAILRMAMSMLPTSMQAGFGSSPQAPAQPGRPVARPRGGGY